MKNLLAALVLLTTWHSAVAAEFYLVKDVASGECRIADVPPASTGLSLLSGGRVFEDAIQAKAALKSISECTSGTSTEETPRQSATGSVPANGPVGADHSVGQRARVRRPGRKEARSPSFRLSQARVWKSRNQQRDRWRAPDRRRELALRGFRADQRPFTADAPFGFWQR